ncbi:MAG: hypothetical protein H7A19_12875 [Rhodanobacteraceae bacterium]|nr:hypothetical protein [Rhodanobacteraceae bacterium]
MQLMWQPDESPRAITGIDGQRVRMGATWQTRSFWVDARRTQPWTPARLEDIDESALSELLDACPEVILLGTGPRARLLAPALQAGILRRGCGIECMDNAAAARTYNVLLGEGRAVLAAFLIDAD